MDPDDAPAITASQYGDLDALRALHARGADLNAPGDDGMAPAQVASHHGHAEAVCQPAVAHLVLSLEHLGSEAKLQARAWLQ